MVEKEYKLPKSVIEHYSKFRRKGVKNKINYVLNTKFELDEKYEIIDASISLTIIKKSWSRSLWNCRGCAR